MEEEVTPRTQQSSQPRWELAGQHHLQLGVQHVSLLGTLNQTGSQISGTMSISGSPCSISGTLSGTVSGLSVTMSLTEGTQSVSRYPGRHHKMETRSPGRYPLSSRGRLHERGLRNVQCFTNQQRRRLHLGTERSDWLPRLLHHQLRYNLKLDGGKPSRQLQYYQLYRIGKRKLDWKPLKHIVCRDWPCGFEHLQLYRGGQRLRRHVRPKCGGECDNIIEHWRRRRCGELGERS